jgi:hypothetical protein
MNAAIETRERQSLEKFMRKAQRSQETVRLERERTAAQARKLDRRARQDFFDAARDLGLCRQKQFKEGELSVSFNDAAEFVEGADRGGDDDEDYVPDWKDTADDDSDDNGPKLRPRRDKGYGYRRDSD